jgi:lysyl-tRNA synthetase class 1
VIPRAVDEYLQHLDKYAALDEAARVDNPAWHIHAGQPPEETVPLGFGLLMNLAGAANAEDREVLWGFIRRYAPEATPQNHPILDALAGYAVAYYQDFVKPTKRYRAPDETERVALEELATALEATPPGASAEDLQNEVYEIGKRHGFESLRDWFRALYEVLLGQSQGPRMGSFVALYGIAETARLIRRALAGEDLSAG